MWTHHIIHDACQFQELAEIRASRWLTASCHRSPLSNLLTLRSLDFAGLEREIARLAARARDRSLTLDELSGGTFTLSNGGVYGSLLSTPILNPPQSGILGLHKIQKRPVAADDQVVIRPMMYVALSYDHRIVDGEQAVSFLIRIKERLEDPERMLLDV